MCSGQWARRSQRRRPGWSSRGRTGDDATRRAPGAVTTSVTSLTRDLTATVKLVRRSSKAIDKTATERALCRWGTAPDPWASMAVELGGGQTGDVGNIVGVRHRYPREGLPPEEAPPAFDEVEPGGADGDEGVLDARMYGQPVPNGATAMAGEIVTNKVEVPLWKGVVERVQQREVSSGIARGGGLGETLPIAHAERAIDPDLVESPLIVQRRFDAVSVS
jgi:hypothetical protein